MTELKEQEKTQCSKEKVAQGLEKRKKPLAFRAIKGAVRAVWPKFRLHGEENIPSEPCILIANHSQMHGPVVSEIFMPENTYAWCIGEMTVKEMVADYAYRDFWSYKPKYTQWFYKLLSKLIPPLAVLIFNNARTIPVWHDGRIINTIRESAERLSEGNNIMLFPEKDDGTTGIVSEFQDGFVEVARFYQRRTGRDISFVPTYISPKLRGVYFGKPIAFDPEKKDAAAERARICDYLRTEIEEMARSLPEHIVVPYRNVKKREYPKNK